MSLPEPTPVFTRPTSPHLQIYKPQITTVLSILHRATGLALVAGTIALVGWLMAAAYSISCFNGFHEFFGGYLGKFMLLGWTVAFYYHLCNGLRHLWWDTGHGLEIHQAEHSGWLVVVMCGALTVVTWIVAFSATGASS